MSAAEPVSEKYRLLTGWLPPDSKLRAWIQASRLIGQLNLLLPLALAQAFAWSLTGQFSWSLCLAIHLFGFLDGLFISYANDVADAEADSQNTTYQLFSGGSRVIPEGRLSKRALAIGALVMLAGLVALSAALTPTRPWVWVFTLAAVLLMQAYSYRPLRLSYRGHGEALQALGLGIVLPLFGYYVQVGDLAAYPWLTLVPLTLFGYAANICSALPDSPSDAAVGKHTYPVRMGNAPARLHAILYVGVGIVWSTVLAHDPLAMLLVALPAAAVLAICVRLRSVAEPSNHAAARKFVYAAVSSINLVFCGWIAALLLLDGTRPT